MAQTLQSYLSFTRFILEDALSTYWSDANLTTCINLARDRVIHDTACCRSLQFIPTVPGQTIYTYNTILAAMLALPLPPPARAVDHVMTVNFSWSSAYQPPLKRISWTQLNAMFRVIPTIQSIPTAFANYGQQIVLGPPPASSLQYQLETDAIWLPTQMQNLTDTETAIPDPLAECLVPLMTARWAHFNRRAYDEADKLEAVYEDEKNAIVAAQPGWFVEDWYTS